MEKDENKNLSAPETVSGVLPDGVFFAGKKHTEFVIRPERVGDMVEAFDVDRAQKNVMYAGVVILSKRIVKLGDIPAENITPKLLLEMSRADYDALQAVAGRRLSPAGKTAESLAKNGDGPAARRV